MNWILTGGSGLLGHELCRYLVGRGHRVTAVRNQHALDVPGVATVKLDLTDSARLTALIEENKPDVVLHAAGITNVDACERDEKSAYDIHARVAGEIARKARERGARTVLISTDHLWDGSKAMVTETEPVSPINVYAKTKAAGETLVLESDPESLVLRTNFFGIGPIWRKGLVDWLIAELGNRNRVRAFADVYFTPLAVQEFCRIIDELTSGGAKGIYHVAGSERISKYEFAIRLAQKLGLDGALIEKGSIADVNLSAVRPRDMSLSTVKAAAFLGRPLAGLSDSLDIALSRTELSKLKPGISA